MKLCLIYTQLLIKTIYYKGLCLIYTTFINKKLYIMKLSHSCILYSLLLYISTYL